MSTESELIAQDPTNKAISSLESGGNPNAKNPVSTASGKYQFTRPTFEGVKRNNPDLPDLTFEDFQKNADAQELYQQKLLEENTRSLKKHNLDVTPSNQYLMHWVGSPKGSAIIQAKAEDPLGNYLSPEILSKNKLDSRISVGDFRRSIDEKMQKALLPKVLTQAAQNNPALQNAQVNSLQSNPVDLKNQNQIIGQERLNQMRKDNNITPANPNPPAEVLPEHETQLKAIDQAVANVQAKPQGGDQNIVAAQHLQQGVQEYGPRWGMAFAQALFGDKQGALNSITGGALSAPVIAEALVPNADGTGTVPKQVLVNKNARGDLWYTDPGTRQRLPDSIQITSLSPEGAIGTTAAREQAKNNITSLNPNDSTLQSAFKIAANTNIADRQTSMPTENGLINSITDRTKQFGPALDNVLKNPQGQALVKGLSLFKGGPELEKQIQNIVTLANLPQDQIGPFSQYLRDIAKINEIDAGAIGKHAPGAGGAGILDLQGGASGVKHWLAEREGSHAIQTLWNNIYSENAKTKQHADIVRDFTQSNEFKGVDNYKKYYHAKVDGKKPNIPDGAPIMNYKNGQLVLQRYNAKTGRVE
jgi:hypothetical protein